MIILILGNMFMGYYFYVNLKIKQKFFLKDKFFSMPVYFEI